MQNNTVEILASINKTVASIALTLSQNDKNKGSAMTASLSKGDVNVKTDAVKSSSSSILNDPKSVGELINALGNLPVNVSKIAKLDGATMKKFNAVIDSFVRGVEKITKFIQKNPNVIKQTKEFGESIKVLSSGIKSLSPMILIAPLAMAGAVLMIPVIGIVLAVFKLVQFAKINKSTLDAVKELSTGVSLLTGAMYKIVGLVAICMGIGALMSAAGKEVFMNGLTVFGITLGAMIILVGLAGAAGWIIKNAGVMTALKDIIIFAFGTVALLMVCVGIGYLIKDNTDILWDAAIGMGTVLVSMMSLVGVAVLTSRTIKSAAEFGSLKTIMLFAYGCAGIVVASKFVGELVKKNIGDVITGFTSLAAMMTGLVGIAVLASKLGPEAKKGAAALAAIELVALGAVGVLYLVTKVAEAGSKVGWDNVLYAMLSMAGVIVAIGGLAVAANALMVPILLGSATLFAVEALVLGMTFVTSYLVSFLTKLKDSGFNWGDMFIAVKSFSGVMIEIGVLASLMSPLTIPLALAMPSVAMTAAFAFAMIGIVDSVANLTTKITNVGGIDVLKKTVNEDMPAIVRAFSKDKFDLPMSIMDMWRVMGKTKTFASLIGTLVKAISGVADIAKAAGVVTPDGKLRPFYGLDKNGAPKFGEPVDIVSMSRLICDTMKVFVENMNYGLDDVKKMLAGGAIAMILGKIAEPINKFITMLTGFIGGTASSGDKTLTPVRIDENGEIKLGKPVVVKDVAFIIVDAISEFVRALYSDSNIDAWTTAAYGKTSGGYTGRQANRALRRVAGVLGDLVEPIAGFIDLMSNFDSEDGKTLKRITVNSDGSITTSGDIHMDLVANGIVSAMGTLIDGLYDVKTIEEWGNKSKILIKTSSLITDSINVYIDFAKNLSDKNINADVLIKNSNAITTSMTTLFGTPLMTADVAILKERVSVTKDLLGLFTSNQMWGVQQSTIFGERFIKELQDGTDEIIKSNTKLVEFKKTFAEINDIIMKESAKRKKAVKETADALEDMVKKISNASNDIKNLKDLLIKLENLNTNEINRNSRDLNLGFTGGYSGGWNGGESGGTSINYDKMKVAVQNAIADAFTESTITLDGDLTIENTNDYRIAMTELIGKLQASTRKIGNLTRAE